MKGGIKICRINSILSIFGLALLLLLSPCKVRNYIQAELGISTTKALSKSQTTVSHSNCETFEFSEFFQTVSKPTIQKTDALSSDISRLDFTIYLPKQSFNLKTSRAEPISDVPLYILYQNLLVYS